MSAKSTKVKTKSNEQYKNKTIHIRMFSYRYFQALPSRKYHNYISFFITEYDNKDICIFPVPLTTKEKQKRISIEDGIISGNDFYMIFGSELKTKNYIFGPR